MFSTVYAEFSLYLTVSRIPPKYIIMDFILDRCGFMCYTVYILGGDCKCLQRNDGISFRKCSGRMAQ